MKKLVVFTGAGVSAESGIKTFRDSDGLWENYRIEDVATPEAWRKNRKLVLDFYNIRRRQVVSAKPNPAHLAISSLERFYETYVITQNIDDLHERAGSSKVIHLHGEILKARSSIDPELIYYLGDKDINEGDVCERGSQLRPHIVWFGELVPQMDAALDVIGNADVLVVVGTSLQVFPAAGLVEQVPFESRKFLIDPNTSNAPRGFTLLHKPAGIGMPELAYILEKEAGLNEA